MSLKRLVAVLGRHAVFIAALTALMVLATALFSFRQPDRYSAGTLLEVQALPDEDGSISLQSTLTARERAVTIERLANTRAVKERASRLAPAGVYDRSSCSVTQIEQSEFLRALCTSEDQAAVAAASNAQALSLRNTLDDQRQQRIRDRQQQYRAQIQTLRREGVPPETWPTPPVFAEYEELAILDEATRPSSPFEPNPQRAILIALVLGLVINSALAFLLEYAQDKPHEIEDVERTLAEPILGAIPVIRQRPRRPRVAGRSGDSWERENEPEREPR